MKRRRSLGPMGEFLPDLPPIGADVPGVHVGLVTNAQDFVAIVLDRAEKDE